MHKFLHQEILTGKQFVALRQLAISSAEKGNLPNGALLLDSENKLVYQSESKVASDCDATAHAERLVIEQACKKEHTPIIRNYSLITVVEPCLMCLSAAYWAGIKKVYYIIPAAAYWDVIPWMSESKTINKYELIAQWNERIEMVQLGGHEGQFIEIFDNYKSRIISR
ncbi:MAG: hypothetical protein A2666_01375 [Parcubacteria group bacterium RIFCSPHIGHO2_01_FULL_47_10b]|nr:MAG: hypothetical protein A2666_01375 [Parcubacteria group bacterium RIFCSPHIGHO2_01_FULL_47_10b]